jgi:hypothetical protein
MRVWIWYLFIKPSSHGSRTKILFIRIFLDNFMYFKFILPFTLIMLLLSGNVAVYGQNETQKNGGPTSANDQDSSSVSTQVDEIVSVPTPTDDLTQDTTPPTTDGTIDQVQQGIEETEQQQNRTSTIDEEQKVKDNIVQNVTQTEKPPEEVGPVADAGPDKTVEAGETVMLDGGGSYTENGTIVEYQWRVEEWDDDEDNLPSLQGETTTTPSFVAPYPTVTPVSSYGMELMVTDSNGLRDSDWVVVRVNTPTEANSQLPVANAGPDRTVKAGESITLDGTDSFARNGTIVNYEWAVEEWDDDEQNIPILEGRDTTTPTFIAPFPTITPISEYGIYLTVTDSNGLSDTDWVVVGVETPQSQLLSPVSVPGSDQTLRVGDRVELDGSNSFARNGTIVSYQWTLEDWADEEEVLPQLQDHNKPVSWFIAQQPTLFPRSQYMFELYVTDSNGLTDTEDTRVTIIADNATNTRPIAIAEISDDYVCEGRTVILDASRSHDHDVNDSIVSYKWEVVGGDGNDDFPEIANTNAKKTTIDTSNILHSNSATYEIELTVRDNRGGLDKDQITLSVEKCPYRGDNDEKVEEIQTDIIVTGQSSQSLTTNSLNSMIQQNLLANKTNIIQALPNCESLSKSTNITGQLLPNEIRMLAYFGNCHIANGTLTLNIQADPILRLLAGHIDNTTSDMIEVNMTDDSILEQLTASQQQQQMQQQSLANIIIYQIPVNNTMTGIDPVTQIQRTVNGVNGLALWNANANANQSATLDANNTANVTVTFMR